MSDPLVLHIGKVSGISGSENHLLALLPGLRAEGWDARFLLLHEDEPGAHEMAARLEEAGVPVEAVRLPHVADPVALARVHAVVRRQRPHLVHTHLVHADFYGLTAARLARVPVLASTKHGFNAFRSARMFGTADRLAAAGVNLHIAISHGLAAYLSAEEGFSVSSFEVVHYGIEAGPEPAPASDPGRLAIVGRLIPIKGHTTLLTALHGLPDSVTLAIAGDGELAGALRDEAASLADRVRFLGRVAPATTVFERAGIVVVPSLGEGFGMVALEAMERGRAVVASAVGGLPEIVADGETGLLVPPSDPAALHDALASLVSSPDRVRAMGEAGRRRALEVFSQRRNTARTGALYDAALVGASRRRVRVRRSAQARSTANAASTASTKSQGTR